MGIKWEKHNRFVFTLRDFPLVSKYCDVSTNLKFSHSSNQGAMLALPKGADREELLNQEKFTCLALANAAEWYKYCNGERGWLVANGSLHLIVGTDKTSSWALAACSSDSGEASIPIKLTISRADKGQASFAYTWKDRSSVECRASDHTVRLRNQCVFIRSRQITVRNRPTIVNTALSVLRSATCNVGHLVCALRSFSSELSVLKSSSYRVVY